MRKSIVIVLSIFPSLLFAQLLGENTLLLNEKNETKIGIEFNGEANSTTIGNSTLTRFYQANQVFTSEDLQSSVNKLNDINYAGANAWVRMYYQEKMGKRKPIQYYRISVEYVDLITAKFSGDMLGLVMLGNSGYEDKTAELGKARFTNYNAQKVGFYIGKDLDEKTKIDIGGSFLKGGKYQNVSTNKGSLYTAPYGEYLEGEIDFTYASTPKKKKYNVLGYGASTDIHWSYRLKDTSLISVGINDLGMMNWLDVKTSSLDTSFYFEGLVIDNIFDTINLSTDNISPDSAASVFGVKTKTRNKWAATPFTVFANYNKKFSDKVSLSVGVQYTYGISLLPLTTAMLKYKIKEGFTLSPIVSYGGFGSYNIGLGMEKTINENINLRVQSRFLDGFALYTSKGGQGLFLSMIYKL